MAQVCMVTGKTPLTAMNVSHSHIRTKRRLNPNLRYKRYWVPSEKRFIRLRVSTKGMRIIDKLGIDAVIEDIRARGIKV
jgi:large subunit ribosomal protein L28